jgi:pyruvate/2-oxoglutarate dehydrogenase complex dihydrolipoamide dehydrogenase (E3) component
MLQENLATDQQGESMKYDYDIITIGLGPAGMAVAVMGSEMGLKVCAIEKHKVGGECMNVGCIPSKALLRIAKTRAMFDKLDKYELTPSPKPELKAPFQRIAQHLNFIADKKTMKMFKKVKMIYQEGAASFVDAHTVEVAGKRHSARRIFICAGTRPSVPSFPGLDGIECLTNENMFSLEKVPESMIVIGGGAIACEMAQAFSRLGSKVTMIIRGPRLMWRECQGATDILEATFESEGITILRDQNPTAFSQENGRVKMTTDKGQQVEAERVLVGAGRAFDFSEMKLEQAGIATTKKGAIAVDRYLRTSQKNVYACGDCNGFAQFSHAAMHQGMLALMNSMAPWPFKKNYQKFVVPWTVFSEPQISHVGPRETDLLKRGVKFEAVVVNYGDYGAAIAENVETGFIRALVSATGKIYAVTIVGEGSGEMINEWALAIQQKIRLHQMMLLQHSFPTMGFLSKRTSEVWMTNKMKSGLLQSICRLMFRI